MISFIFGCIVWTLGYLFGYAFGHSKGFWKGADHGSDIALTQIQDKYILSEKNKESKTQKKY